ncbi:MAG: YeaH/YhbH family protein [Minisyncoccia bacterium]
MQHVIVDLSEVESGRSLPADARFRARIERELKEALAKLHSERSVTDLTNQGAVTIKVKLPEPEFDYDRASGNASHVVVGNPTFWVGDRIPKPPEGIGSGNGSGAGGSEALDPFTFEVPADELERRLFEELELPDMAQKQIVRISETTIERAGFMPDGPAARLDLVRSARLATGRRVAFQRPNEEAVYEAEEALEALKLLPPTRRVRVKIARLTQELAEMHRRRIIAPYFDKGDLRYRRTQQVELPISQAVIFNLMDVSGSMTEHHKKLAKYFFWLLRRFLTCRREYTEVDIVWIKHTDTAQEVTEKDFFFSKETGGTVVSSALEKMLEVIKARYPLEQWNIYCCQATDGDTWYNDDGEDDAIASSVIINTLVLPIVQYYAYVECWEPAGNKKQQARTTRLWDHYDQIVIKCRKFQMKKVHHPSQIYPVFQELFSGGSTVRRRVAA